MVAAGRAVAARRRALQRRALRFDRPLHHRREPGRQRRRGVLRTRVRSSASSGMRRTTQRLRQLGRGLRDADLHRARLPQRSAPASTSRCSRRSAARPRSASRRSSPTLSASISRRSSRNTSNEIIIDTATGGRTTYKNAGKTRRRGVEAAVGRCLGGGLTGYAAYTYLSAEFAEDATTGHAAADRAVGVAPAWRAGNAARTPSWPGRAPSGRASRSALEAQYAGKLYVNERNTDAAPAYTVANVRVGFEQRVGDVDAARIRPRQQPRRPQLRRLGDRRRHQRALLRAVGAAQLPDRRERECQVLTRPHAIRRP